MNLSANFCCENSVTRESKTPALCLVCGLMVCSQSHCCETIIGGNVQTEYFNLTILQIHLQRATSVEAAPATLGNVGPMWGSS